MKYLSKYWVRSIHFKHLDGDTGGQKKTNQNDCFLEMISNDLPEHCSNTCTTLNGSFTHRWRHFCKFDESTTIHLAYSAKFDILKQFSVPPILRIWMNLVTNVLTGGQEECHIKVYIRCHPMTLKMAALLIPQSSYPLK